MYVVHDYIDVLSIEPNKRIAVEFSSDRTITEWHFSATGDRGTYVSITSTGFSGEGETLLTDGPNEWIDEQRDELKWRQIPLFESPIRRIVSTDGDAATDMYQAIAAASMGALAGIAINGELLDEAWNQN